MHSTPRVVELFCGIGGCAAALGQRAHVGAAVDQNRVALRVYSRNFAHTVHPAALESIPERTWRTWDADLWWMSPPCRPFTTRGARRDLDDPRARGFEAVVERIVRLRPPSVAIENVPGFAGSRAHALTRETLDRAGYAVRETLLCPTELGLPNRRRRFYLVAALDGLAAWPARTGTAVRLADLLDHSPARELWCDPDLQTRYAGALNVVDAENPAACTACFTSAYGRSVVRSGSYLATATGLRRFSPREILRLLDFPAEYELPPDVPLASAWSLVGNSVSVRAVRWVLAALPGANSSSRPASIAP
jgi:DNA (cytosine-5)-methyltransferase 1